ncbi:MAG: hypothetical protein ACLR6B_03475 [Blautia sp.]
MGNVQDDKEDEQIKRKITKSQLEEMHQLDAEPVLKPAGDNKLTDDEVASLLEMVSTLSAEQFRKLPKDVQELVATIIDDIENSEVHISVTYANDDVPRVSEVRTTTSYTSTRHLWMAKKQTMTRMVIWLFLQALQCCSSWECSLMFLMEQWQRCIAQGINPRLDSSYTETLSWTDKKMLSVTCKALGDAVIKKGALVAEVSF